MTQPRHPRLPRKAKNLQGQVFGLLTVTAWDGYDEPKSPSTSPQTLWAARCTCGHTKRGIRYGQLTQGRTRTCGHPDCKARLAKLKD